MELIAFWQSGMAHRALAGKADCFTCLICGQKRNLWLEQGKWFVEAYCSVPESRAS